MTQILAIVVVGMFILYQLVKLFAPEKLKPLRLYIGFLKTWVSFHVFLKFRKPLPHWQYAIYVGRINALDSSLGRVKGFNKQRIVWEIELIKAIFSASGFYKQKYTGSAKHKLKIKFWKDSKKYKIRAR